MAGVAASTGEVADALCVKSLSELWFCNPVKETVLLTMFNLGFFISRMTGDIICIKVELFLIESEGIRLRFAPVEDGVFIKASASLTALLQKSTDADGA